MPTGTMLPVADELCHSRADGRPAGKPSPLVRAVAPEEIAMLRFKPALAAVASLAVACLGLAVAAPAAADEEADEITIAFLHINDFHGRIASAVDASTGRTTMGFAAPIEWIRDLFEPGEVILLSAGDNVGASLFASAIEADQPTLDVLNTLGLAASAVGNHEFDRGWADLRDRIAVEADFPYLGANVYAKGTQDPVLPEYAIVEVSGLRIGVIGAVTQETPTLVSPAGVADLDFGDPVEAVNRVAEQLANADLADFIVAEYHEGSPIGNEEGATLEDALAASATFAHLVNDTTPLVKAIFTGHTHKTCPWMIYMPGTIGDFRPVLQAGAYGAKIGLVSFTLDKATGEIVGSHVTFASTPAVEIDPDDPDVVTTVPTPEEVAASPTLTAVQAIVDAAMANAAAV
ncbi:MAG: bifunctional metallophosphatase/5'-nucleotidase, partial [Propionibacteriaceae bacterium]|nr:bifunctional metallophosphatase/5'-nucleotidase [Propionibacteriaceae bacterium]